MIRDPLAEDPPVETSYNCFGEDEKGRLATRRFFALPGRVAVRGKTIVLHIHPDKTQFSGALTKAQHFAIGTKNEPHAIEFRPFRKDKKPHWRAWAVLLGGAKAKVATGGQIGYIAGRSWQEGGTSYTGGQSLYRFLTGYCSSCERYGVHPDLTQTPGPRPAAPSEIRAALIAVLQPPLGMDNIPL